MPKARVRFLCGEVAEWLPLREGAKNQKALGLGRLGF